MNKLSPITNCVEMVGPDVQMDQHGSSYEPANRLPARCAHCSFPDLDFVPQPYLLTKGVSSPAEISSAQMGNFLVRERVRRILEAVVPQACGFYPAIDKKTKQPADWFLAIPKTILQVPGREADQPLCPKCGQPKTGYSFSDHAKYITRLKQFDSQGIDVFKSQDWDSHGTQEDHLASTNSYREQEGMAPQSWKEHIEWAVPGLEPPSHPERWTRVQLGRLLFFSVRLEQLLKREKIKGQLVRSYSFKEVQPSAEDEVWIKAKLQLLDGKQSGSDGKTGPAGDNAQKWFKQFLKRSGGKAAKPQDFSEVEKKQKITLPQDYKKFIAAFGLKTFADVCGLEGTSTRVLLPRKLDFKNYRRGKVPYLEGEQAQVDGVVFAEIDNGDCFVFDVSAEGKEYPVYWHKHEENDLEAFAANFAECIKRFSEKS